MLSDHRYSEVEGWVNGTEKGEEKMKKGQRGVCCHCPLGHQADSGDGGSGQM